MDQQPAATPIEQTGSQIYPLQATLLRVFDHLPDGLLLLDNTDTVLVVNHALATLLELPAATLQGQSYQRSGLRERMPYLPDLLAQTRKQGQAYFRREYLTQTDDQTHILDVQGMPLPAADATLPDVAAHVIISVVDVTRRLHLEAMLIERERQAATTRLSATLAHEVNTPLQAIQSSLYLAARSSEPARARHVQQAQAQVLRIGDIVQRLLDMHQVSAHPPARLDTHALLQHIIDLLRVTLQEQGMVVQMDMQAANAWVWGYPDDLQRALLHLVLNAMDAMPSGGTLTLHTRLVRQQATQAVCLLIEIGDTGHGIAPEIQPRIFDPFVTTRPEQAGIGLTMSQRIVQAHGGKIAMRSQAGQGSIFSVTLPLSPNYPSGQPEALSSSSSASSTEVDASGATS